MKKESIEKLRKIYGYLASLTIFVTIIHLIGFILFQSFAAYDSVSLEYSNTYGMAFSFSASQFAMTLGSLKNDLGFVKLLGAITSVLLGLSIIFLSTQAVTGNLLCRYIGVGLYILDTLFVLPEVILSLQNKFPLKLSVAGISLSVLLHLVFLLILGYSLYIAIKLQKAEKYIVGYNPKENKSL